MTEPAYTPDLVDRVTYCRIVAAVPHEPDDAMRRLLPPRVIADGVVWPSGRVVVHWPHPTPRLVTYDTVTDLPDDTVVHWIDQPPPDLDFGPRSPTGRGTDPRSSPDVGSGSRSARDLGSGRRSSCGFGADG